MFIKDLTLSIYMQFRFKRIVEVFQNGVLSKCMARSKVEWSLPALDRCFPQFLSADDHVSVDFR